MDANEIISRYVRGESLKSLHRESGICIATLRRILITAGVQLRDGSDQAARIQYLAKDHSIEQIADMVGRKPKTVAVYLPYQKGSYSIGDKSINAQRIAACRARKRNHASKEDPDL